MFVCCKIGQISGRNNRVSPAQKKLIIIRDLQRPSDKSRVCSILESINFFKYRKNCI